MIPKTENVETTELTKALKNNGMTYEVVDITRQTYDLLKVKREAALAHQAEFEAEGHKNWFELLLLQTECAAQTYKEFAKQMTRYIFVARK